jgi:starch phosphorylase
MEASGTSGMKAGMNGAVNLSVLDGWWNEGYDGSNGWAIKPATGAPSEERRDQDELRSLYELLQDCVIPLYYNRGPAGYSPGWIAMAKRSLVTLLPRFNTARMLNEYLTRLYVPAATQGRRYQEDAFDSARQVAAWRAKVSAAWNNVSVQRHGDATRRIQFGETVRAAVAVNLDSLAPSDIVVEMLIGRPGRLAEDRVRSYRLQHKGPIAGEKAHLFVAELTPDLCGRLEYRIRVYPHHELLTHRFEMGMMRWL